jgi:hypothetical protein
VAFQISGEQTANSINGEETNDSQFLNEWILISYLRENRVEYLLKLGLGRFLKHDTKGYNNKSED